MLATLLWLFAIVGFALLIVANFACQVYVSNKLYDEGGAGQVIIGVLRGTNTFIRGWRQANELGIRTLMIVWSIVIALLVLLVCLIAGVAALTGNPGAG
jgi:ABC-type multidrug transport system permease subunit